MPSDPQCVCIVWCGPTHRCAEDTKEAHLAVRDVPSDEHGRGAQAWHHLLRPQRHISLAVAKQPPVLAHVGAVVDVAEVHKRERRRRRRRNRPGRRRQQAGEQQGALHGSAGFCTTVRGTARRQPLLACPWRATRTAAAQLRAAVRPTSALKRSGRDAGQTEPCRAGNGCQGALSPRRLWHEGLGRRPRCLPILRFVVGCHQNTACGASGRGQRLAIPWSPTLRAARQPLMP